MASKKLLSSFGAVASFDGLFLDPNAIVIEGLDVQGAAPELTDPDRIADESGLEALADSIERRGILQPVMVRLVDGHPVAVDGRRRIRAARIVAARQAKAGSDVTIRVPCVVDTSEDLRSAAEIKIIANEHRRIDTMLEKARNAARMRGMGYTPAEVAVQFGVTRPAVDLWLSILKCLPEIQALVESGKVRGSEAAKIGKLSEAKQREWLAAFEAPEEEPSDEESDDDGPEGDDDPEPKGEEAPWTKKQIEEAACSIDPENLAEGEEMYPDVMLVAYATLQMVLGKDPKKKGLESWSELRDAWKDFGPLQDLKRKVAAEKRKAEKAAKKASAK